MAEVKTQKDVGISDQEIVKLCLDKRSSEKGFRILVENYREKVYWTVRRMVIDHDESDDVVQGVFISIWKNLKKFRGDAALSTWIYRIAVNETLNHLRTRKRKQMFMPLEGVERKLESVLDEDALFTGDKIQALLQKAISQLPARQRMVFNMRYFDEMTYEQASEILGTSVGALKASYHFAVKKIEDFISRH